MWRVVQLFHKDTWSVSYKIQIVRRLPFTKILGRPSAISKGTKERGLSLSLLFNAILQPSQ
jgi:hypothetical protein